MAEKLVFQQALRERGAVYGHESLVPSGAGVVYGLGYQVFSGAGLALEKDADVVVHHLLELLHDLGHLGVLGNHVLEGHLSVGSGDHAGLGKDLLNRAPEFPHSAQFFLVVGLFEQSLGFSQEDLGFAVIL